MQSSLHSLWQKFPLPQPPLLFQFLILLPYHLLAASIIQYAGNNFAECRILPKMLPYYLTAEKNSEPVTPGSRQPGIQDINPNAWDTAYATQGRLWGGVPLFISDLSGHSRVLDLGCGSGKLLKFLIGKMYECIGIDFSENACRLARKTVKNPDMNLLIADVRQIPLRSCSIDAVFAYHVAGHLPAEDRSLLVEESAQVLSVGGKFIFCDFSVEDFRAGKGTEVEEHTYRRGNGILTHYFTEDEVRLLSEKFIIETIRTIRWPMKIRGTEYPRAEIAATFVKR